MFRIIIGVFLIILLGCGKPGQGLLGSGMGGGGAGSLNSGGQEIAFSGIVTRAQVRNEGINCQALDLNISAPNGSPMSLVAFEPLNNLSTFCIERQVLQISPSADAVKVGARVQGTFIEDGNRLVIRTLNVVSGNPSHGG